MMTITSLPPFTVPSNVSEARSIQDSLRARLRLENDFLPLQTVAGVDVGYDLAANMAHASIVVLTLDGLQVRQQVKALAPAEFPYVPGFLSFREIPAILQALVKLDAMPDLLMVDGQGIAHPRRMGIAAHLGVLLDRPSLGVAKSLLCGQFAMPDTTKCSRSDLVHQGERIGTVLRSRNNVKPLFISPGHRLDHETAVALVLQCLTRYRLPEPTRLADKYSKVKAGMAAERVRLLL